jgi:hypothetical protein
VALARPLLSSDQLGRIGERVAQLWQRTGFQGDVASWIGTHTRDVSEQ